MKQGDEPKLGTISLRQSFRGCATYPEIYMLRRSQLRTVVGRLLDMGTRARALGTEAARKSVSQHQSQEGEDWPRRRRMRKFRARS